MNTMLSTTRNSCPKCQSATADEITYGDTVDFRGMEFDVENLHESKCQNCGYTWSTSAQGIHNGSAIRQAYGVIRDELRAKNGLLAGHEIAQMRELFELSQREAATLFGGGYNAFNKYESGEVLQSFAMDRLLRLSAAVGMPAIEFLRNVFSPPSFLVITTSRPNEVRITIGAGGGIFNKASICGTSQIQQAKPVHFLQCLENQNPLPVAHEKYSVITR